VRVRGLARERAANPPVPSLYSDRHILRGILYQLGLQVSHFAVCCQCLPLAGWSIGPMHLGAGRLSGDPRHFQGGAAVLCKALSCKRLLDCMCADAADAVGVEAVPEAAHSAGEHRLHHALFQRCARPRRPHDRFPGFQGPQRHCCRPLQVRPAAHPCCAFSELWLQTSAGNEKEDCLLVITGVDAQRWVLWARGPAGCVYRGWACSEPA
jgi:hypothetical protein